VLQPSPPQSLPPSSPSPAVVDLPVLTGLRFPMALWVVLYHAEKIAVGDTGYVPLIHHGYLGVDVFFLISGFILAHVYGRRFAAGEPGLYRHFLWLRLARVWPAYAAVLLAAAALELLRARWGSGQLHIDPGPWSWELVKHLAMVQSWGLADYGRFNQPGWSLSAEWAAYLSFPVFLFVARPARTARTRVAVIAVAMALLWFVYRQAGFSDLNQPGGPGMPRLAVEFLSGILLCAMAPVPGRNGRSGDVAVVAGLLGVLLVLPTLGHTLPLGDVLALPFFGLVVWGGAAGGPLARRKFANPAMLFLGAASYSIYLVQSPVIAPVFVAASYLGLTNLSWWPQLAAALCIAASVVAGSAVYLLVEQPARSFLRRWRAGAARRLAA
jgi:peptidoglycan/LPS O-acetylase OafA/YrhL